ncbi:precorrin-4 C(11)-methyltransferase [Fodinicola acaciae]|uniref:precorrin-4 C(11)-methyltransferase n=1 Tax=Fodinicola acaciae TaxID=2681555 RepID=UPI0013D4DF71|nr:precorrin-4 C(11)-methyltransferase [Fodinicola acaciae]
MTVRFIGAGPGAADLITLRARKYIEDSPVCLYAGSLVPEDLLAHCPAGAKLVDTANLSLDEIVADMLAADRDGLDVARLHSGDPSVFSAVAEQTRRLDAAGVAYEIVPGVPAFAAAAAALKRELTVPGVGQTVILTRTSVRATPMPEGEDLATLGKSRSTIVLHLAVQRISEVVDELVPNYGEDCPVAVVAMASRPDEIILRGTLADIAAQVRAAGIRRTAVIVVGRVLTAGDFPDSHLYSAARDRPTMTPARSMTTTSTTTGASRSTD